LLYKNSEVEGDEIEGVIVDRIRSGNCIGAVELSSALTEYGGVSLREHNWGCPLILYYVFIY